MKTYKISLLCVFLSLLCVFPVSAMPADLRETHGELRLTDDLGTEYLDRMVFLGESTTTHLRSRGGLRAEQVWANNSGTMKLDSALLSRPITDAKTGEHITVAQAAERYRPEYLVLSFGLNGITGFIRGKETYLGNYRKLIEKIREASPSTRVIVQSVYPVAEASCQTDWRFSVPPEQINDDIRTLNGWLTEFCDETPNVCFADTASVLYDGNGFLRGDYTTDGIHLTESAYREILLWLRTHMWGE